MKPFNPFSTIKASRVLMMGLLFALVFLTQACSDAVSALDDEAAAQRLERSEGTFAAAADSVKEEPTDGCAALSCQPDDEQDEGDPGTPLQGTAQGEISFQTPQLAEATEGALAFTLRSVTGRRNRTAKGTLDFKQSDGAVLRAKINRAAFSADGTVTFSGPVVGGTLNTLVPVSFFARLRDGGSPGAGNDQFAFLIANPDDVPDGVLPVGAGTEVTILDGDITVKTEEGTIAASG